MSRYAVIKTGGKQYRVEEGQELVVEKIDAEKDKPVEFKEVLLLVDEGKAKFGTPVLDAIVKAKVLEQSKDKKIVVSTYKAKTGYHRKKGHRQLRTKVLIEKIS